MGLAEVSRKGDTGGGEKQDTLMRRAYGCLSHLSQGTESYQMGEDGETHQSGMQHTATHCIGETPLVGCIIIES